MAPTVMFRKTYKVHRHFDREIVVVGYRHRCLVMHGYELRTMVGSGHCIFRAILELKHPVLERYGIFALLDFPDQLIAMPELGKKFIQADEAFDCIETVYGMGYRWNIIEEPAVH